MSRTIDIQCTGVYSCDTPTFETVTLTVECMGVKSCQNIHEIDPLYANSISLYGPLSGQTISRTTDGTFSLITVIGQLGLINDFIFSGIFMINIYLTEDYAMYNVSILCPVQQPGVCLITCATENSPQFIKIDNACGTCSIIKCKLINDSSLIINVHDK